MGTTFTCFNPFNDENGQNLSERFANKINNITDQTMNVYCIYISDDKLHKYKINSKSKPVEMKDYTPLKLYKYIFGDVFRRYVDNIHYKNMTDIELEQICKDFAVHIKNTSQYV